MSLNFIINNSPRGSAYIGWTPILCSLQLTDAQATAVSVAISAMATGGSGGVSFRSQKSDNPATTINLAVPADGSGIDFFMAGTSASSSDQDILITVKDAASGATLATRTIMVRIRKNANTLSTSERDRFLNAIYSFNISTGNPDYNAFLVMHNDKAYNEIHTSSPTVRRYSFLIWHRAFVLDLERRLQLIDPSVTIPYWKFDEKAPNVFSADFMGTHTATGTLQFSSGNPMAHWRVGRKVGITRVPRFNDQSGSPSSLNPPALTEDQTLKIGAQFAQFTTMEDNPHGPAHVSFSSGPINYPPTATQDPLFFLLHANVDRLWALWQKKWVRYNITQTDTYPIMGGYQPGGSQNIGDFIDDTMWPWNNVFGAPRPPSAPSHPFPPSISFTRPTPTPEVWEMIDYQGIMAGVEPNGADYDDIFYN